MLLARLSGSRLAGKCTRRKKNSAGWQSGIVGSARSERLSISRTSGSSRSGDGNRRGMSIDDAYNIVRLSAPSSS
jgi:hypothetical protein